MLTDCKARVIEEHAFSSRKGSDNLVYITVSSGIGCGILHRRSCLHGCDGSAGEAGRTSSSTRRMIFRATATAPATGKLLSGYLRRPEIVFNGLQGRVPLLGAVATRFSEISYF